MSSEESQLESEQEGGKWWIFLVYISTLAPWGIMQVHDAIDATRGPVRTVRYRLAVSTVLILGSTVFAVWYVVWAASVEELTESATVLVGVGLNSWHWVRVFRGWYSSCLLLDVRPAWEKFFTEMTGVGHVGMRKRKNNFHEQQFEGGAASLPGMVMGPANGTIGAATADPHRRWCLKVDEMEVNDSVIDNDSRGGDRSLFGANYGPVRGVILWRMVWLQGVEWPAPTPGDHEVSEHKLAAWFAAGPPPNHGEKLLPKEEALDQLIRDKLVELERMTEYEVENMHVHGLRDQLAGFDREIREKLVRRSEDIFLEEQKWTNSEGLNHGRDVRAVIDQRKRSLEAYGPGQQDHGDELIPNPPETRVQHVWDMMTWITAQAPKPMENIWYESKDLMVKLREIAHQVGRGGFWPPFPKLESWFRIAGDIARQRDTPLLLSVLEFKRYALRIASTSALMAYNPHEYCALVKSVYDLGIMARWTHGWSGRLSCYSSLWTPGNVGMSLLGGLTLLVLRKNVASDDAVRCLLVGIASENIMARYMPDKVHAARTEELATRYYHNQGKTCRGSGVKCVRMACEKLGLSRSASQLDGCVAFAVGWAKEVVDGLPGNQKPRDGNNHGQIEDIFCSSKAYRFTDERF